MEVAPKKLSYPTKPPLEVDYYNFTSIFCCNYKHKNGGKFYNNKSCTTMRFVGKAMRLLETQKLNYHNFLTYLLSR
jgi:hypothetical protein